MSRRPVKQSTDDELQWNSMKLSGCVRFHLSRTQQSFPRDARDTLIANSSQPRKMASKASQSLCRSLRASTTPARLPCRKAPQFLRALPRLHAPTPAPVICPTRNFHSTSLNLAQSSVPHGTTAADISIGTYHRLADNYIDELVAELEELQEDREEVDVEYSAGVLTLVFPPNGTYVLNKQPPNKQIWLSSPVSGPKRYDFVGEGEDGKWIYLRDGSTLTSLLKEELSIELEGVDA